MKIGYARVCRYDEDKLAEQVTRLTAAGCKKVFSDVVETSSSPRPQLELCLSQLAARDVLVVVRMERLGRSIENIINIISSLYGRNVWFQSLDEEVSVRGVKGRTIIGTLRSLSGFKDDVRRVRVAEAKADGVVMGRRKGDVNKVNRGKPETCKKLYENGTPVSKIKRLLNIRSDSTVYRYLKSTGASRKNLSGADLFESAERMSREELLQLKREAYEKNHQLKLFSD